jgi:hypothetical protein
MGYQISVSQNMYLVSQSLEICISGCHNVVGAIKSSYTKHSLAYRINWEIYTPQAGEKGMLLHRKGRVGCKECEGI